MRGPPSDAPRPEDVVSKLGHPGVPLALCLFLLLALAATHERTALAANPEMARCLSANEKAITLRAGHQLLEAREQSLACTTKTCPAAVRAVCTKRVAELARALPTIVLQVKDPSGADVRQARVTMDGQPFAETLDGTGIETNPGDHTLSVYVPGHPVLERSVLVYEGRKDQVMSFQLPTPPTPPPPPAPPPSTHPFAAWKPSGWAR